MFSDNHPHQQQHHTYPGFSKFTMTRRAIKSKTGTKCLAIQIGPMVVIKPAAGQEKDLPLFILT
jgi:hypothetical protein